MAREAGHEITTDASNAEVLVVNTCAFIDSAKQESIDAILEMAAQKRDGHCSRLVVTGCLAERYRDELRKEIPEIDAVLGTGEVPLILDAIGARDPGLGARDRIDEGLGAGISPLGLFRKGPRTSPEPRVPNLDCGAPIAARRPPSPRLPLRRRHSPLPDDAETLCLCQGGRGL